MNIERVCLGDRNMKQKKIFLLIFILALTILILPKSEMSFLNLGQIVLFTLIGFISIMSILNEYNYSSFSLNIMHWLFVFFFFFVAPVAQLSLNFHPWGIIQTNQEIIGSSLLVLLWIIMYKLGNHLARRKDIKSKIARFKSKKISSVPLIKLVTVTLIAIGCLMLVISRLGLSNLFARSTAALASDDNVSKMSSLIFSKCTRGIIVFSMIINLINYYNTKKYKLLLLINIICLTLACFPTGMSRNAAASIYVGLFIVFFYKKLKKFKKSYMFIAIFLAAFIIIFPAINVFRRHSFNEVNMVEVLVDSTSNFTSNFASADYDAFSLINDTVKYVEYRGLSYGKNLASSLFFFIPRSIWKTKSYGSGQTIFESFGAKYTNISCPLVAEGYINFGIIGVILFAFIAGYCCSYIDKLYWANIDLEKMKFDYLTIIYPFMLPSYFFLLRGDLMSTFAYASAYIVIFYFFFRYIRLNIKFR